MKTSIKILATPVTLAVALSLTACGGGGGGGSATTGGLVIPPDNNLPRITPGPPIDIEGIEAYLAPASVKVNVGVVDTGVKADHFRLADSVAETHVAHPSLTIDDPTGHGTYVAQIIANGSPNVRLFISKASDQAGEVFTPFRNLESTRWLHTKNVRAINYSIHGMYDTSLPDKHTLFVENRANNVVSVLGAGNTTSVSGPHGGNITAFVQPLASSVFDDASLRQTVLVVGALDAANNLASYSYFPGERADIQSRFLVALGPSTLDAINSTGPNQSTVTVDGTSTAAPKVTAAVTNLLARWPSLTAQEATDLILTTANRSFTNLYALNNCGATSNVNCGLYTFGQGKLDMLAALQPAGPLMVPLGATVKGSSVQMSQSTLSLPSAFGDAARSLHVNTAVFDSLGRDYTVNAGQAIGGQQPKRMMRLFEQRLGQQDEQVTHTDRISMRLGLTGGEIQHSALGFNGDVLSFDVARHSGLKNQIDTSMGDFLSFNGHGSLAGYDRMTAWGFGVKAAPGVKLFAKTAKANIDGNEADAVAADRREIGVQLDLTKATQVTLGYEVTSEVQGLFGLTGRGALALNETASQALGLMVSTDHANGWKSFGLVKTGTMLTHGAHLLSRIDHAKTSEFAAGLTWQGLRDRFGIMVAQPVRVDSAQATFTTASGRALDGQVLRETKVSHLKPSGRQINLELSYARQLSKGQSINWYTVYTTDDGHVRGSHNYLVGGVYRARW